MITTKNKLKSMGKIKGNRKAVEKNMTQMRKMSADGSLDVNIYDKNIWVKSRNYRRLMKKLQKKGVK
tara:strand:- start:160 stop:360 length:201 start_codon:yes stop_codon:yes gene_type:complete